LLEWETIDAEQIDAIMAGEEPHPPKPVTPPVSSANTPPPAIKPMRRSDDHTRRRDLIESFQV
jgi:hypothetical protein